MGHSDIHMYTKATTCDLCGKTFYATSEWAYVSGYHKGHGAQRPKRFCSWKCLQKWRNLDERRKSKRFAGEIQSCPER